MQWVHLAFSSYEDADLSVYSGAAASIGFDPKEKMAFLTVFSKISWSSKNINNKQ